MADSVDTLFEALGGAARVGAIIGKSTEHAAAMRRRRSIPVAYWPALIADARARAITGVSYETLALMHAQPAASSEPARAAS